MAYRGDEGDALEAPTADGSLRLELGPRQVRLTLAHRSLVIANKFVTMVAHKKQDSLGIGGRIVVARDVPHEDLGVWIELPGPTMRRIFGAPPVSLLDPEGLTSLRRLDTLAQTLRTALADYAGDIRRAVEIGRGLDKVLLADHGDRFVLYARRLFRDSARQTMTIHADGRIALEDGKEITVTSRFGITVRGDYVRFADARGVDLARISVPWIAPEDRDELARRIGQLVDRTAA